MREDWIPYNPWWQGESIEEAFWPKRLVYPKLLEYLSTRQMISLVGLRRTGKSTLLKQIISHLLDHKTDPKRILYYPFEESLLPKQPHNLKVILDEYLKDFLKEKSQLTDRVFIFLDEIQNIPKWQIVLKKFYDLYPKIKFFISGSASLFLREKTKESLAGRIFEESISPLSFREYLLLTQDPVGQLPLFQKDLPFEKEEQMIFDLFQQLKVDQIEQIIQKFELYLVKGGFPEMISLSIHQAFQYLRESILLKILDYDLPRLFQLNHPEELKFLYEILARETGNLLEYKNLASDCSLSLPSVASYVNILGKGFLHTIIYNHARSPRKAKRQLKKGYVTSPNIAAAYLGLTPESFSFNPAVGFLVETYAYNLLQQRFGSINFWRQRDEEIDFRINKEGKILWFESKYQNVLRKRELASLIGIHQKNQISIVKKYCLTRSHCELIHEGEQVIFAFPIWLL
ncbi:MAG: ATP-binding protein [Chlamydiae bacterium]|nr:ATP-binding protein [Chlamydiota bacterium]